MITNKVPCQLLAGILIYFEYSRGIVDYGEVCLNAYRGFYLADTSAGVRGQVGMS